MTRIVHVSDLHFGATSEGLLAPLCSRIADLSPDLVVISGDLTQRARSHQFAEARDFIAGLGVPVLCIPGNHDIPLWNIAARLICPWRAWRMGLARDLEDVWQDAQVIVAGINTANPLAWKQGRITAAMLDRLEALFATAGDRVRIVAMHHPLEHLPGEEQWLMQGAGLALCRLPEMGVRMVLSGHIHVSHAGPFTAAPGLLFVQAGTGLSWRRRAEANAFNLLDIRDKAIEVQSILADETGAFAAVGRAHSFPHVVA